jgi:hypothetical protein
LQEVIAMANRNGLPVVEEAVALDGTRMVRLTHRGAHFYVVPDGRVCPSPTAVLKATMSKEAVGWAYAAKERERAVQAAVRAYTRDGGRGLSPQEFEQAVWEEVRSSEPPSATKLGLEVHGHVFGSLRRVLYGEKAELPQLSPDAVRIVDFIRGWWREAVVRPLHAERVVVGDGWVGTLDCLAEIHGRGLSLVDLKVTRAREPVVEWFCQAAAYAHAAAERYGVRATPMILAVHPDTCEVRVWPVEDPGRWYRTFVAALDLYRELSRELLAEVEGLVRALQVLRQPAGAA